MTIINPSNWYWVVGGSTTQAYSSAIGAYVPAADATYTAWLNAGNQPSQVDTAANLGSLLWTYNLRPNEQTVLDGFQTAGMNAIEVAQFKISFNQENRIRTLEGRAQLTAAQFLNAIKNLL